MKRGKSPKFSRFAYLDTNILSILTQDTKKRQSLSNCLHRCNMAIAVSTAQVVELSPAKRLHRGLEELLGSLPSVLTKPPDVILEEEVRSYPNRRTSNLTLVHLSTVNGMSILSQLLSSTKAREEQLSDAKQMKSRLDIVKANYPKSRNGKHSRAQAEDFASKITYQWVGQVHLPFLKQLRDNKAEFKAEVFRSIHTFAFYLFYKHYMKEREVRLSDFGDLFHMATIPYCKLAIVEKDMCNILNQIKSHHKILCEVEIEDIRFLSS